jgi:small subunit ribosomal protein S1
MNSPETLNPDSESQISSASAQGDSFGDILSEFEDSHRHTAEGQAGGRQGTVVAISPQTVFVDIGFKTEGILPVEEFRNAKGDLEVKVGDQFPVSIKGRDTEGYYLLSKTKVERPKDWSSLERAFAEKRTIGGVVTGTVKGGLTVDVGVRAFLPASRSGVKDSAELETLVGQDIACKIIKLDVADEDVVVDRRAVLEEEEKKAREEVFAALQEGAVVSGTVRSLTDFGAFVDLGGIDGLLHVTDMAWHRVSKPSDILSVGDSVEVKILKVDRSGRRISLGLKQLVPDPWTQASEKYDVGDRVHGKVVRVADFGAFVELEPGVEGLIHISDLSWSKKGRKPKDVVKPGELVEVAILSVHAPERRIGLGLKQALGDPWEQAARQFPVGSVVEGPVTNMAKFGAFVELVEGVEGMIHVGDISAEKRIEHPQDVLKKGEKVRAMVLEIDPEKRRIRLGLKQLQPTTTDEYIGEHSTGDTVTGRVVETGGGTARVEVAEGVFATCQLPKEQKKSRETPAEAERPDLNSLTAMLAAKWKQGKPTQSSGASSEAVRTGQIRTFRIVALDSAAKRIELELAG